MTQDTHYITLVLKVPNGSRAETGVLHDAFFLKTPICGLEPVAIGWGNEFKRAEELEMDLYDLRNQ